jgi:hypothetical protein
LSVRLLVVLTLGGSGIHLPIVLEDEGTGGA